MTTTTMQSPTVRRIIGPTILLASGAYFDLMDPEGSAFTLDDIAHGLSHVCRFAGQSSRFYSVAQHSVLVSRLVPEEDALAGLMHDAAEAFIGDVSKPLKVMLPDYQALEKRVEAAVFARFGLPATIPASVKDADLAMLATEQHALMPDREGRSYAGGKLPLPVEIRPMGPSEAKALFLARFADLTGSPPRALAATPPEARQTETGWKARISFELSLSPEGRLHVSGITPRGLILSSADHDALLADIGPAIRGLLKHSGEWPPAIGNLEGEGRS